MAEAAAPEASRPFSGNFLPLDTSNSKAARKLAKKKGSRLKKAAGEAGDASGSGSYEKSNVVYVGRIPHGFYEEQMRGFFSQFGTISKLRISRNKKSGKSKHFAFLKFESPEVAAIVADCMHNYLLFESMLQVKLIPLDKIHDRMWVGANRKFRPRPYQEIARKQHNRVRTLDEQAQLLRKAVQKDKKRRKKLEASGIDYQFPSLASLVPPQPKRTKYSDN